MNKNRTLSPDESTAFFVTPPRFLRKSLALVSEDGHGGRQKKGKCRYSKMGVSINNNAKNGAHTSYL